jgi:16S rRNA (cytosine1402-N4)-methyltransferase
MRMNQANELSAEYIVNTFSEDELNDVFKKYGEIFKPYRVTRALVHDRKENAFKTTRQLAGLIERVDGWKQKGMHPATKYFMALRLVVNRELEVVEESLAQMASRLKPGGRLCVITFHSLEDRIVKNGFKDLSNLGSPVFKKVVVPSDSECAENPRSRSAKLRIFERKEDQG